VRKRTLTQCQVLREHSTETSLLLLYEQSNITNKIFCIMILYIGIILIENLFFIKYSLKHVEKHVQAYHKHTL